MVTLDVENISFKISLINDQKYLIKHHNTKKELQTGIF